MKNGLFLSAACLVLFSCSKDTNNGDSVKQKYCSQQKSCGPKPVKCCPGGSNHNNEQDCNDGSHKSPDWQITMGVKKAIMSDSNLSVSARFVSVSTSDGVVTLTGTVRSKEESRMIERAANNVTGVKSVNNELEISQ